MKNHAMKRSARLTTKRVRTEVTGVSLTEQHHKKSCDINTIVAKYRKTGLLDHIKTHGGTYGDVTGMDFKEAQDLIATQKSIFTDLPATVRAKFDNDPAEYLDLVQTDEGVQTLKTILDPEPELEPVFTDADKKEEPKAPEGES